MFAELKTLIPPPGMILIGGVHEWDAAQREPVPDDKQPFMPEEAYEIYRKCWKNALDLLNEAELLAGHKHYARAVAIGISAWEELGKSQIAADFYTGILHRKTYEKAFRKHQLKTAYLARTGAVDTGRDVAFNVLIGEKLEKIRQDALYVSERTEPKAIFGEEEAEFIIARVREHMEAIEYAEIVNDRIGSKALFK